MEDLIIELTDDNFKAQIEKGISLVDFWADWCAPCVVIAPIIEEIAKDFKDRIKVCKIDIDKFKKAAQDMGIMSIPTLVIFKDGREIDRIIGAIPKDTIAQRIEKLIAK